ncbi:MAG TPA: BamA/TamA family outer membrane protein [Candidatus Binataceae bacterium]|nr:BamA/TamA family outer membrane protein [Candidatus Binataceae bacterium]
MKRILATLMLAVLIIGKLTTAHAFDLIDPQTWGAMNPHTWPFTLIPIPEIATDPNGGVTAGALFATLFKDNQNQISDIFAPDINYNTNVGAGGALRFLSFPSENTQWYAMAEAHENIQRQVDMNFSTGRTHDQWWSFDGRLFFERDPTERFYGVGNWSRLGGETNYTTQQLYVRGSFGWNITKNFQVALVERPRYVRIQTGAFNSINQTVYYYPNQKGVNGGSEIYNELRATYDTRDSADIPRSGGIALIYGGITDRRFMSSASYNKVGANVRHYWTLAPRVTLATNGYVQYIPAGNETPFWSMARLGGQEDFLYDQMTLRGYGAGRFVDNNMYDANVEVRTRVFEADVFGTHGVAEIAPFAEAGRVAHQMSQNPVSSLHPVSGVGFRAIAEPFVVGYVDVGIGGEGAAVFSGINYPF